MSLRRLSVVTWLVHILKRLFCNKWYIWPQSSYKFNFMFEIKLYLRKLLWIWHELKSYFYAYDLIKTLTFFCSYWHLLIKTFIWYIKVLIWRTFFLAPTRGYLKIRNLPKSDFTNIFCFLIFSYLQCENIALIMIFGNMGRKKSSILYCQGLVVFFKLIDKKFDN